MNCHTTVMLLNFLWVAAALTARADEGPEGEDPDGDNFELQFFVDINRRAYVTMPQTVEFDDLPNSRLVVDTLQRRPECSQAVGGTHVGYVIARLRTTKYLAYWIMAARKSKGGRVQAQFGFSKPRERVVALFQPFWTPTKAWAENLDAGAVERIDLLPYLEKGLGFKSLSLTSAIVRALMLLHEQAHLNDAIPSDELCLAQSMLNTRIIADACMPEIVLARANLTDSRNAACQGTID
jgi:hypothetical protein